MDDGFIGGIVTGNEGIVRRRTRKYNMCVGAMMKRDVGVVCTGGSLI